MDVCKNCEHYAVCLVHCSESVLRNRGICEHFKNGWISVKDRLPEYDVLAANFLPGTYGYKEYIIGYVSPLKCNDPRWERDKCIAENDYEILENVTHWMPLPEPPKE